MGKAERAATYEDIEALPVGWVGEIFGDDLVASPRPAMPHARVASVLGMLLGVTFDVGQPGAREGWWIIDEPELHLGRDVVVPDLAGWRRDRMPVPPFMNAPFSRVAPDWACEILSPSSTVLDRERKLPFYHREGVGHVWLIDPSTRRLEIHRRRPRDWLLVARHEGEGDLRAEPFDALALKLGALWWPQPTNTGRSVEVRLRAGVEGDGLGQTRGHQPLEALVRRSLRKPERCTTVTFAHFASPPAHALSAKGKQEEPGPPWTRRLRAASW